MSLYDLQQHRALAFLYGRDPGVDCHGYAAWNLWLLGYPEQALAMSREAVTLSQELAHPHSLAFALNLAAVLHQFRREGPVAHMRAQAMTLATEQGFPQWLAVGTFLGGWALVRQGREAEGTAQTRQGLAAWQATGAAGLRPYILALLAEAHGQSGRGEEGLTVLAEALALVDTTAERWWKAELHPLKGELLLQCGVKRPVSAVPIPPSAIDDPHSAEAEACFHQALAITRRQQTKSLELRAATSLARLWQQQDKRAEAKALLEELS